MIINNLANHYGSLMSQTDSILAQQQLKYTHEVPARLCKPDIGCISIWHP